MGEYLRLHITCLTRGNSSLRPPVFQKVQNFLLSFCFMWHHRKLKTWTINVQTTLFLSPLVSHLATVFFFFLFFSCVWWLWTVFTLALETLLFSELAGVRAPGPGGATSVGLDHHGAGDNLLLQHQQVTSACWNLWDQPAQHNISVSFLFTDKGPCTRRGTACFFRLAHRCQILCQGKKHCSGHQGKVSSPPLALCSARGL